MQTASVTTIRPLSPRRRFLSALFGGRLDRPSAATPTSIACVGLMEATGAWFPEAHLDASKMAALAAAGHTLLGYDTVAPLFSVITEAAALGAEIDWGRRDSLPINLTSPWADPDDVRLPGDFLDQPSTSTALEAIAILRRELGQGVAILGKVMGPWTLAYHMHGVSEFLIDIVLEPRRVHDFLAALAPISLAFARAQMRAGADAIVIADHATGDMVRADTYAEFLLPVHQSLTAELGCPTIFHCCGHSLDRIEYFAQAGFDAYHFESANDARQAMRIAGGRMSLAGNINGPEVLLRGTPRDVQRAVRLAAAAGLQMIAPECAVAPTTPVENLKALADAVAQTYWSKLRGD